MVPKAAAKPHRSSDLKLTAAAKTAAVAKPRSSLDLELHAAPKTAAAPKAHRSSDLGPCAVLKTTAVSPRATSVPKAKQAGASKSRESSQSLRAKTVAASKSPRSSKPRLQTQKAQSTGNAAEGNAAEGHAASISGLMCAKEAAQRRLEDFKSEVFGNDEGLVKDFGRRHDEFYMRFLTYNEVAEKGEDPDKALTMLTNYTKFVSMCRKRGYLNGLGAEAIRPYMKNKFIRMLTTRDKSGRRIMLTSPYGMNEKVPTAWQARICVYWFIKLMTFDDTLDRGWLIMHDFTGVTLGSLTKLGKHNEAKDTLVDNTFPWVHSKILFVNTKPWLRQIWKAFSSLIPASMRANAEIIGDISNQIEWDKVEAHIDRAALPKGRPYNGELDEEWDAALHPGLGVFFEPEMDGAENAESVSW